VAVRTKVYHSTAAGMAELVRLAQLHHHPTDNIDAVDLDFLDTILY
jgi:hypothetical protein